jgi:hypothetical protein
MKVKELIEILSKLDGEKDICPSNTSDYGYTVYDINSVKPFNELAEYEKEDIIGIQKLNWEETDFYIIE